MTILFVDNYHKGVKNAFYDADMTKAAGTVTMTAKSCYPNGYSPALESWSFGAITDVMVALGNDDTVIDTGVAWNDMYNGF